MSNNDWQRAEQLIGVCLRVVQPMSHGCWLCTDSGKVKRYVVGRLDNGDVFVEKCSPNFGG
jgi:hypothetical protein